MNTQQINLENYLEKIQKVELMLNEIKQGLSLLNSDFQESIKRGEKDILKGNVFVCRDKKELDDFFDSI